MQFVLIIMMNTSPASLDNRDQKANILIQDTRSWEKEVDAQEISSM